jgi:hypothetical protein
MLVGGASVAKWSGVSSAFGQPAQHYLSSAGYPDGFSYTFSGPVGAVRLGSTAIPAGSSAILTMRVMQGELGY